MTKAVERFEIAASATVLAGFLVFGTARSAEAATESRGLQLTCSVSSSSTDCKVKNMPLVAQCGTSSDPVDSDLKKVCKNHCATTSHMTILSAAYANRTVTNIPYPSNSLSATFFSLPPRNKNGGRNSWLTRRVSQYEGTYYPANGLPTPNPRPTAYSPQNAVYDLLAPGSPYRLLLGGSTVVPSNCDLGQWWSCDKVTNALGADVSEYLIDAKLDNNYFKKKMDASYVSLIAFHHQNISVYTNGVVTYREYVIHVAPHKVAVSGYKYDASNINSGYLRINDVGDGTARLGRIGMVYPTIKPTLTGYIVTVLPYGNASFPYLKFSDEDELKLIDWVEHVKFN